MDVNIISLFQYYLSLGKGRNHSLKQYCINFPSPKDTLCQVWLYIGPVLATTTGTFWYKNWNIKPLTSYHFIFIPWTAQPPIVSIEIKSFKPIVLLQYFWFKILRWKLMCDTISNFRCLQIYVTVSIWSHERLSTWSSHVYWWPLLL